MPLQGFKGHMTNEPLSVRNILLTGRNDALLMCLHEHPIILPAILDTRFLFTATTSHNTSKHLSFNKVSSPPWDGRLD